MASIAGLGKIGLPRLSENMDPEDVRALRNYLYQMQEQLQYVLCNLDINGIENLISNAARSSKAKHFWFSP